MIRRLYLSREGRQECGSHDKENGSCSDEGDIRQRIQTALDVGKDKEPDFLSRDPERNNFSDTWILAE